MRTDQIKVSVVVQVVEDEVLGCSHGTFHFYGRVIVNLSASAEVNMIDAVFDIGFLFYDDVFDAIVVQVGKRRIAPLPMVIVDDVGIYGT